MTVTLQQLAAEIEISEGEITGWIEQKWVLPGEDGGRLLFDDADQARVRLIAELRGDLGINDDALPVVLRLLDQVYGLRQVLDQLREAIAALPDEARGELEALLREAPQD